MFTTIIIPTRPQTDTIVAIFLLKKYGADIFSGIKGASYRVISQIDKDKTEKDFLKEGSVLVDVGGGIFDHHGKEEKTTASNLVAEALGVKQDPSIRKLLDLVERCDFYGKATISNDPLDRAFGIAGLISALNKTHPNDPHIVIDSVLPLINAHHEQEKMRTDELPKQVASLKEEGLFSETVALHKNNKLKVCFVESDDVGLPGFLRATDGGKFDIVVQRRSTGHVNILTRPLKKPDIRAVVALIREKEYEIETGKKYINHNTLELPGRNEDIPCWYFDPATNSLQNGGVNPGQINATKIEWEDVKKIVISGLESK